MISVLGFEDEPSSTEIGPLERPFRRNTDVPLRGKIVVGLQWQETTVVARDSSLTTVMSGESSCATNIHRPSLEALTAAKGRPLSRKTIPGDLTGFPSSPCRRKTSCVASSAITASERPAMNAT